MTQQYDEPTIQAKLDAAVEWILSQEEYHCPPEDGREDWEPWEFDLMDQLMRGCRSLRIPVEYVLADHEGLPMFVADLHERDATLIADVARQVAHLDRAAGARLVDQLIELVQESRCRDEIGWLAAEQLIGELERLL